ncbi:MAG TPA: outer membrane lipoprotein chaperone LolA [Steroidobacteraceae bacterium]|nr:outer membrane lipoprotein chaperone LolA [Steroidobacteraceae bacterium]
MKRVFLATLLCVVSVANATKPVTSDAYTRLDGFLRDLKSFQAEFHQVVRDAQGRKVEESSGQLALSRPNRFRWDYRAPHAQVIVADGEKLWLYDPDLEQVTVKRLDQSFAGTPAMLLSGEGDLRESFKIEGSERRNGVEWVNLTPKRADVDFKLVRLALRDKILVGMELSDKLGQVTLLEFSKPQRNPTFDKDRFVFAPPAGVDVIGGDASAK